MQIRTTANILGALAQAVRDDVHQTIRKQCGYSESTSAALVHLAKYPGEVAEGLRKPLGISHPGCVRLIDRLERDGLVERKRGGDGRSRALILTSRGEVASQSILAARDGALRQALVGFSAKERELLADLLTRVLVNLIGSERDALTVCRLCDYESCPDSVCPSSLAIAALDS